jgi:endogenous inhibitor of DNA gyrase (YacG/DUF329 family)
MAKRDGYWSGWASYRYGSSKPVSLAKPFKAKRLSRTSERDAMVASVMNSLKDWRSSEFEHEAATRQAIRGHFICTGAEWASSDLEADLLVQQAFQTLGYERPTLGEGQWQYTAHSGQCMRCQGPVDEEDQAKGYRFCSVVCAKASNAASYAEVEYREDWIRHRAQYEFSMRNAPDRRCKVCNNSFKSFRAEATTCSPRCARHSKGDLLEQRTCGWCEEAFQPNDRQQRFCCKQCAKNDQIRQFRASQPEVICECCRAVFRPGRAGAVTCSTACSSRAYHMRKAALKKQSAPNVVHLKTMPILTPAIFDSWFQRAA